MECQLKQQQQAKHYQEKQLEVKENQILRTLIESNTGMNSEFQSIKDHLLQICSDSHKKSAEYEKEFKKCQ